MSLINRTRIRRFRPVAWSMGSRVLAGVSFLLVNSYLARRLGPADFGVTAVVTSVAMFGAFIVSAGVNRVLLRNVAGGLATSRVEQVSLELSFARRLLIASIPIGGAITFVMSAFFVRNASDVVSASIAGSLVAVGAGLMLLLADLLRGLGEVPMANLGAGRNGGAIAMTLFAGLLMMTGHGLLTSTSALLLNVVALTISVLISYVIYRRFRPREVSRPTSISEGAQRAFVASSLTFMGTQVAAYAASQVDLWVVSGNLSEASAGIYAAALRLMGIVSMPLLAAQLVVSPRIAALRARGHMQELEALVRRTATILTVPAVLILLPCLVAPASILTLFYGRRYAGGAFVLAALGFAQMVNAATGLCGITLAMCSKERLMFLNAVLWTVLSFTFDLLAARIYGLNGVAVASALTTAGQFITLWVIARISLGVWTHPGRLRMPARSAPAA